MKRILLILTLSVWLATFFGSCKKDLGNYDYQKLDTIGITGIEKGYIGITGKTFSIVPTFSTSFKKAIDSNHFRFEWFAHNWAATVNADKKIPLATTRNLDITLPLGAGSYVIYYRLFDKSTGEMWQNTCNLNVTSEIGDGWLVLNEIDGGSRLDMLNYKPAVQQFDRYTDLLASTSDLKLEGKPVQVYYTPNKDIFNNNNYNRVYVSTNQATYSINNQSRAWTDYRNFKMEVMRLTGDSYHAKQITSMASSTPLTYIIDSDDVLMFENKQQVMLYGAPINRLNTGSPIKIAPYIACFDANRDALGVFYDVNARRFLVHSGTNKVALIPKSTDVTIVTPENMRMDLLYLDCALTATKQFYALLKDPVSQNLKLYRFVPSNANFSPLAYDNVTNLNKIDQADAYAIDPTYGYLIYAVGSKIYQYDPFNKVHSLLLDLPGRTISLLKYQRFIQNRTSERYKGYASKLMVCTYDQAQPNTSGKMELYKIQLSGAPSLDSSFEGFGKIVSVTYRE
jgi:hypothetical protein